MKRLVFSRGYGARPLTHSGPKHRLRVANKPNIEYYCLEDLRDMETTGIWVILGNVMPERIQGLLGGWSKFDVKPTYIVQQEPKGRAHAVNCVKEFMSDSEFVVCLGGNLPKNGIKTTPKKMKDEKADCVISLTPAAEPQRYGIAELYPDCKSVLRTVEKPRELKLNLAAIGVYAFDHVDMEQCERRLAKPQCRLQCLASWISCMSVQVARASGFAVVWHLTLPGRIVAQV